MRQTNIELCRIVAILLVLLLHSNYSWCGWPSKIDTHPYGMYFVESFSIIGVNVFVFITGWFSTTIKRKSIFNLLFICFFYAVLRLCVGATTGAFNVEEVFFISKSNWFVPAYLGLILLTPWLNSIKLGRDNLKVILALLLFEIWFGYLPAKTAVDPGINYGYSVFSFSVLYLLARYIRQNGIPTLFRQYSILVYIICSVMIAAEGIILMMCYSGEAKNMGGALNNYVYAYNNPLVIVSSVAFFVSFEKMKIRPNKTINYVAKSVIAILLFHTSKTLNRPMKEYFNDILCSYDGITVILMWILGILAIFSISVVIDQCRILIYNSIQKTHLFHRLINNHDNIYK